MALPVTRTDSYPLAILSTKPPTTVRPSIRKDDEPAALEFSEPQPSITVNDDEQSPPEIHPPPKPDALTDWDGPADPANPKNWGLGLRIYHTMLPALYGFSV